MNENYSMVFNRVANVLGMTPANLAKEIQGLLSPQRCRDTRAPLFNSALIRKLNCGRIVSQH